MTRKQTNRHTGPGYKITVLLLVAAALGCAAVAATERLVPVQTTGSGYTEQQMINPDTATPLANPQGAREETVFGRVESDENAWGPVPARYRSSIRSMEVEKPIATF